MPCLCAISRKLSIDEKYARPVIRRKRGSVARIPSDRCGCTISKILPKVANNTKSGNLLQLESRLKALYLHLILCYECSHDIFGFP